MTAQYKTPGVYVEENNNFGSSIVQNETAIPIFIGFTEYGKQANGDDLNVVKGSTIVREPVLISSMLEYNQVFGGADVTGTIEITTKEDTVGGTYTSECKKNDVLYVPGYMQPSVYSFFSNGGGSCYVISLGTYDDFNLIEMPKTISDEMPSIERAIELSERGTLILPTDLIRFGAENYYSWGGHFASLSGSGKKKYFTILDVIPKDETSDTYDSEDIENYRSSVTTTSPAFAAAYFPYLKSLTIYSFKEDLSNVYLDGQQMSATPTDNITLISIQEVKSYLSRNYINMPPSPYMAGIYSQLDNNSGVWTPPANVSPVGVAGPTVSINNREQENMNVDPMGGKSVNAIRSFAGRGTLVWGARTNDGNSMDWRYINVRRLFNSMENDISTALEAFVFKPNVHNTWVEVKTMIESYLFGLYSSGAFAGTSPESCYQVQVGLGETMTDEDILDGYMRVSILVAPVRPAEFIVLTFSQMIGQ